MANRKSPPPASENIIARRELRNTATKEVVTVVLFAPARDPDDPAEWTCRSEIRTTGGAKVFNSPGSDSLAALLSGVSSLRYGIKELGFERLSWLDVEGWVGLPLLVPDTNEHFLLVIEALIQAESAREVIWRKALREGAPSRKVSKATRPRSSVGGQHNTKSSGKPRRR